MDNSGHLLAVVASRLPASLRRVVEAPIAGEHARKYVEIVRESGFSDSGQYSPHAERVLRAELLAWPRVWRGVVTLVGTLLGGLGLGLGISLLADFPIAGVLIALIGLIIMAPSVAWGLRVVRDGREVKRAFRAWSAGGDRLHGPEYPSGLQSRRPFSARGAAHATLMGIVVPGMFASWALPFYTSSAEAPAIERVGMSVTGVVAAIAATVAVYALWRTPWQMFYRQLR